LATPSDIVAPAPQLTVGGGIVTVRAFITAATIATCCVSLRTVVLLRQIDPIVTTTLLCAASA